MQRRHWYRYLVIALVLIGFLAAHEMMLMPDGHSTTVHFFDVGQGDSIFITGPHGQQVLIDGGPDLSALTKLGQSMPYFDRTIDWLVLTHPHLDHVASLPQILRRYNVGHVLISGAAYENGPYQEFLTLITQQHIPVIIAVSMDDIDLGDGLTLDVLWPAPDYLGRTLKHIHDSCIMFKMQFDGHSILFTGDAETSAEQSLIDAHTDLHADILKVGHHGSRTSTSSGFLLAVHPSLAVISVAKINTYGLPHPSIVRRIKHFGIPIMMTMSGAITVRMNEDALRIQQ